MFKNARLLQLGKCIIPVFAYL